jgi:hypothetical protein
MFLSERMSVRRPEPAGAGLRAGESGAALGLESYEAFALVIGEELRRTAAAGRSSRETR